LDNLPSKFRARHDGGRGHDGILFGLGPHAQVEVLHAFLRQLALRQGLLSKLVEESPRHALRRQRLIQRSGVLPSQQAVEIRMGPAHQLVVFGHAAKTRAHHHALSLADQLVELEDLQLGDPLGILNPRLDPRLDGRFVRNDRSRYHRTEKIAFAAFVEARM
jgi:hypothetical protein